MSTILERAQEEYQALQKKFRNWVEWPQPYQNHPWGDRSLIELREKTIQKYKDTLSDLKTQMEYLSKSTHPDREFLIPAFQSEYDKLGGVVEDMRHLQWSFERSSADVDHDELEAQKAKTVQWIADFGIDLDGLKRKAFSESSFIRNYNRMKNEHSASLFAKNYESMKGKISVSY